LRVGLLVGDCTHNLRSAADSIAQQLVCANGGTPDSGTEFPVFWDADKYKTGAARKIKGMSDEAMTVIERMQPYRRPDPTQHPLYIVHHLDIRDKHKEINVVGCAIRGFAVHSQETDVCLPEAPSSSKT
jgi:hypothetical protein